jgi:hypothetical protein
MPTVRLQVLAAVVTSLVEHLPTITAQARSDSTFDQRARAAWIAVADSHTEMRDGTLPLAIARLAGLAFQAKSDRLTPDLDSALALSVMSGGTLRGSSWGWFALARQLQKSRGSCAPASDITMAAWAGHCRRVYNAYQSAINADSSFLPAIADLDEVVPSPGLFAEPDVELSVLTRSRNGEQLPPGVAYRLDRRRALLLGLLGPADSLGRLLGRAGDGALTLGELRYLSARQLGMVGQGTAALVQLLMAASDRGPGEHVNWLRADLALVADREELAVWDSLAIGSRAAWLDSFWTARDFLDGHGQGRRYVEHVARFQRAYRDYRMWSHDALLSVEALRSRAGECPVEAVVDTLAALVLGCGFDEASDAPRVLDDRGLAYIRHGEPGRKANYSGMWHFARESWLYNTSRGPVVIHFARPIDKPDIGMRAGAVSGPPDQWMAACEVTPRYCVLAARYEMGARIPDERMLQVAERGREEMLEVLSTDGVPQRFRTALRFNAGAYALGSRPGRVTVAVDAPLEELRKIATSDSTRVGLRWQVRIRARDGAWPVSSDSVQSLILPMRTGEGDEGKYLTLTREISVPPGNYDLRLVLSDSAGTTGAMYSRDGFVMIGGESPNLSDLLLMPDGAQGAARTIEGNPVRISPTFTPGSARFVQVGYLLTGFAGQDVRVTVAVTEVGKADGVPRISVSFSDRPSSNREFRTQRLGLERLGNGAWDLTVSALLPDRTTVSRVQRMVVTR